MCKAFLNPSLGRSSRLQLLRPTTADRHTAILSVLFGRSSPAQLQRPQSWAGGGRGGCGGGGGGDGGGEGGGGGDRGGEGGDGGGSPSRIYGTRDPLITSHPDSAASPLVASVAERVTP